MGTFAALYLLNVLAFSSRGHEKRRAVRRVGPGECSWNRMDTLYKQTAPSRPWVVWNLFLWLLSWLVDSTLGSGFFPEWPLSCTCSRKRTDRRCRSIFQFEKCLPSNISPSFSYSLFLFSTWTKAESQDDFDITIWKIFFLLYAKWFPIQLSNILIYLETVI